MILFRRIPKIIPRQTAIPAKITVGTIAEITVLNRMPPKIRLRKKMIKNCSKVFFFKPIPLIQAVLAIDPAGSRNIPSRWLCEQEPIIVIKNDYSEKTILFSANLIYNCNRKTGFVPE